MRVVVVGATGNIGTAIVRALAEDPGVQSITGVARRAPDWQPPKTTWAQADIGREDLTQIVSGADAVIHTAWAFHPSHHPTATWQTNVEGSIRLFDAVRAAGVPVLLYSSSVGAYSPRQSLQPVAEDWPTHGWPTAAYTREKAYLERVLDVTERDHPDLRVVRMRPGFVFQRAAATEQRRIFVGPLLPSWLVRPGVVPAVPALDGLVLQIVHAADVAEAFRLALHQPARGAFNLATAPTLNPADLAKLFEARTLSVPNPVARRAVAALWHAHLVASPPALLDALLHLPVMDTTRARTELGWTPHHGAVETMQEFLDGLRDGAGDSTAPLAPNGVRARLREFAGGVGARG